ncbi:hypothetical protein EJ110_NYTH23141 [Nymphaea thermarum]|nr:hypothetical protein EJ110_NYTH23141 [Nymphaea thermarum]
MAAGLRQTLRQATQQRGWPPVGRTRTAGSRPSPSSDRREAVATGSVFVERKFVRGCGKVGHRGRRHRLGRLKDATWPTSRWVPGRSVGCYKVILGCRPDSRGFYEPCGFVQKELQRAMYFNPLPPSSKPAL